MSLRVRGAVLAAGAFFAFALALTIPQYTFLVVETLDYNATTGIWLYTLHGIAATAVSIGASGAVDDLPALRVSLVAALVAVAARALVVWTAVPGSFVALVLLTALVPVADALALRPLGVAIKRLVYTGTRDTEKREVQMSLLFSLSYAIENGSMAGAAFLNDRLRAWQGYARGNVIAVATAALASASSAAVLVGAQCVVGKRDYPLDAPPHEEQGKTRPRRCRRLWRWFSPSLVATLHSDRFWRFVCVCLLLLAARMLMAHLESTLNVFLINTGSAEHAALIQAINPVLLLFLAVPVPRLLRRVDSYTCLVLGTSMSATAPLVTGLLLLTGQVPPLVAALVLCVLFSLGEAVWSPRFVAYGYSIAPEGSEALFGALAAIPSAAGRFAAGLVTVELVAGTCGAPDACDGSTLWLAIAFMSLVSPVGLTLTRRWLDVY